jgi:hypothetical protein
MKELDVVMTGFTGDDEIREMTENSLKSLRDSEGGEDFNIIFLESNPKATPYDSVDVYVRVLDSWSLIPDLSSSTSKSKFHLTEKNFFY